MECDICGRSPLNPLLADKKNQDDLGGDVLNERKAKKPIISYKFDNKRPPLLLSHIKTWSRTILDLCLQLLQPLIGGPYFSHCGL